jgi:hypothetical protein
MTFTIRKDPARKGAAADIIGVRKPQGDQGEPDLHRQPPPPDNFVGMAATPPATGPPNSDDRVLSAAETASLLGLSSFTLLRMRQRPEADGLPWVQLSAKRIGYRLGDIRSYLQARRVGSLLEVG